MSELTPWFPPEVKPVRVGVYRTKFISKNDLKFKPGYSYWNGNKWGFQYSTLKQADLSHQEGDDYYSWMQDKRWSGLSSDPSGKVE